MFKHKYVALQESYNSMVAKASQDLLENREGYENLCTRLIYEKDGALGPLSVRDLTFTNSILKTKGLGILLPTFQTLFP